MRRPAEPSRSPQEQRKGIRDFETNDHSFQEKVWLSSTTGEKVAMMFPEDHFTEFRSVHGYRVLNPEHTPMHRDGVDRCRWEPDQLLAQWQPGRGRADAEHREMFRPARPRS